MLSESNNTYILKKCYLTRLFNLIISPFTNVKRKFYLLTAK